MATENVKVNFEDDIPSITREGAGRRGSKYNELLDGLKDKAQSGGKSVAYLSFPKASLATSRYTSIRDAAKDRDDAAHWKVVTRTMGDEDHRVYVKWLTEPEPEDEEPKPQPAKKTAKKKAAKKTSKKTASRK